MRPPEHLGNTCRTFWHCFGQRTPVCGSFAGRLLPAPGGCSSLARLFPCRNGLAAPATNLTRSTCRCVPVFANKPFRSFRNAERFRDLGNARRCRRSLARPSLRCQSSVRKFCSQLATNQAQASIGPRPSRLDDQRTPAVVLDFFIAHGEILHAHGVVSLEIFLQRLFDRAVVLRPRHMGGAIDHFHDLAVSNHELATFEHEFRCGKHGLAVGIVAIDRDVCASALAEMAEIS